jgi:hypothetical protein
MNAPIAKNHSDGDTRRRSLAQELEPTTAAVAAAHEAHLHQAVDSVKWERRGVLGRLVRVDS